MYDGGQSTTTFSWTVCGAVAPCPTPTAGFHALGHFSVELCSGFTIESGTTTPYTTADPTCFGSSDVPAVNWTIAVNSGECQVFTLVLAGDVPTGSVQAGTKAGTTCPLVEIPGPVCATSTATPTPSATP